ncbi:MAG TPA: FliA/WhiG family RNA polymerase sigma factor [Pseudonocardia sp.]|jgi:RNA polymerase sigma factor FliA|nr:FliA/WhiG family RNA polymerase sigma factor [Pseudonocardia sp.]
MSRLIHEHDPLLDEPAQVTVVAADLDAAFGPAARPPADPPPGLAPAAGTAAPGWPSARPGGPGAARDTPEARTAPGLPGENTAVGPVPPVPSDDHRAAVPGPGTAVEPTDRRHADAADPGEEPVESLWRAYRTARTRETRDRLVLRYLPLVRSLGHRTASGLPAHVELSDLLQAGVFGLLDAIERYEPARCPRFESYAAQRIRGAMLDELRSQDWVPRTVRGRVRELERAHERLTARLCRAVTDHELAAELGMPVREMRSMVRQVQLLSVEALDDVTRGHPGGVSETLVDDVLPDPITVVQHRETSRQLAEAVSGLGERDRAVLHMYYIENRTLADIGRTLGVTESRVCQLHSRLVGRLRGRLEELAAG